MLVNKLESFDVIPYGREIRFHKVFEPGELMRTL